MRENPVTIRMKQQKDAKGNLGGANSPIKKQLGGKENKKRETTWARERLVEALEEV